jgi:hypothetical protein
MPTKVEGPLKTLLLLIAACVGIITAATFLTPFGTEYEIKTAAKVACNEYAQEVRYKTPMGWEAKFLRRASAAGVKLEPSQYKFEVEQDNVAMICNAEIKYRTSTTAAFIGDIVTEIPPLVQIRHIKFRHSVAKKY